MDVRVKLSPILTGGVQAGAAEKERQEVLTGLPGGSVENLFAVLSNRHPDMATFFTEASLKRSIRIFVNNNEIPSSETPRYQLRDGDTVSLFVKKP